MFLSVPRMKKLSFNRANLNEVHIVSTFAMIFGWAIFSEGGGFGYLQEQTVTHLFANLCCHDKTAVVSISLMVPLVSCIVYVVLLIADICCMRKTVLNNHFPFMTTRVHCCIASPYSLYLI